MSDEVDTSAEAVGKFIHKVSQAERFTDDECHEITKIANALLAERDALEVKLSWQPIETAPKDGTRIRAYFPDWVESDTSLNLPAPGQMETFWAAHDEFGRWVTPGRTSSDERKPTHWRPYPNSPSQN